MNPILSLNKWKAGEGSESPRRGTEEREKSQVKLAVVGVDLGQSRSGRALWNRKQLQAMTTVLKARC